MRLNGALLLILFGYAASFAPAFAQETLENAVKSDTGYTLAPGPNVDGIVYLHGARWGAREFQTFHEIPFIDAASIRMAWREIEPRDQEFDWSGFDAVLADVRKFNAAHPDSPRTMQIRAMAGRNCPEWMEEIGVRFYDTVHSLGPDRGEAPLRVPVPYDNPEFIKQLRELYQGMMAQYGNEPLVTVYHGTWSAGPWAELFLPQAAEGQPLPPDYTPEKAIAGMVEQLDVVLEEFSLKGEVGELPLSGKYEQKEALDLSGALRDRVVERLGRRSPFFYFNSNGWGLTSKGVYTVSWGHTVDLNWMLGHVNIAFQALGSNVGGGWSQGDWVTDIQLAKLYDPSYLEIYTPDFIQLDVENRIVQAFTQTAEEAASEAEGAVADFIGYRPWVQQRNRVMHVREGRVRRTFQSHSGEKQSKIGEILVAHAMPEATSVAYRVRTRLNDGEWTDWVDAADCASLPAGHLAEVEALLHTDDGYFTPRVAVMEPDVGPSYDPPVWTPVSDTDE